MSFDNGNGDVLVCSPFAGIKSSYSCMLVYVHYQNYFFEPPSHKSIPGNLIPLIFLTVPNGGRRIEIVLVLLHFYAPLLAASLASSLVLGSVTNVVL